jgi:hypothetical protein
MAREPWLIKSAGRIQFKLSHCSRFPRYLDVPVVFESDLDGITKEQRPLPCHIYAHPSEIGEGSNV